MMVSPPSRKEVCVVCGSPLRGIEARLYGGTCSQRRCRASYWEGLAKRLQEEKQRRESEEAQRRKAAALAHRDRLAAELPKTTPQPLLPVALPAQQRPLVPLPSARKALFREHLAGVVREAFEETAAAGSLPLAPAEDAASCQDEMLPVLLAGCAVCQGRCCLQGGDRAYLTADAIRRYRTRHPQATAEDVRRAYEAHLAERTYEDSCVYHQAQGCGLPRELRSDTCNGFECQELADLRREAQASGEAILLVALDGSRAVRWAVRSGCERPAEPPPSRRLEPSPDSTASLVEAVLTPAHVVLPARGRRLIRDGLRRSRAIDCFGFVPCDYEVFYAHLAALPPGAFCEWGSGMGIATGLADLLGFQALGIEIDEALAAASRQLLAEHGFRATIQTGDYLTLESRADVYFTYCWPGQMEQVKRRFDQIAPPAARLLICYGAEDLRCLIRPAKDAYLRPQCLAQVAQQ